VRAVLPATLRRAVPPRLRDSRAARALALGLGLIPPRLMHSPEEAQLLADLASAASRAVEIGVYEGGSAAVLCGALPAGAELHLIDPFGTHPTALPRGWGASAWATRRVVARAVRPDGPRVFWHVARSEDVAARWDESVDLVFVDGDHHEEAVARDWELWRGFVASGGRVAFHDARLNKPQGRGLPGPTAVVDRLFRASGAVSGWRVEHEVDRTVVVRCD
jgi:predicted O-methyltransferase YrrM